MTTQKHAKRKNDIFLHLGNMMNLLSPPYFRFSPSLPIPICTVLQLFVTPHGENKVNPLVTTIFKRKAPRASSPVCLYPF